MAEHDKKNSGRDARLADQNSREQNGRAESGKAVKERKQEKGALPEQKNEVGFRDNGEGNQVEIRAGKAGNQVDTGGRTKKKKRRRGGRLTGKQKAVRAAAVLGVIALAAAGFRQYSLKASAPAGDVAAQKTAGVQKMSIVSSLSSSGSLSPKDTYNITSLVSGDVVTADFEEGDVVTEGQILYVIDGSSVETELNTAQNSLERARTSYELAQENYNQALADYSGF